MNIEDSKRYNEKLNAAYAQCPLEEYMAISIEDPAIFATDPDLDKAKQKLRERGYKGDILIDYNTDKLYI